MQISFGSILNIQQLRGEMKYMHMKYNARLERHGVELRAHEIYLFAR